MGVKVAATCLHWSQHIIPRSPSCSHTLASAISSRSSKKRSESNRALVCRFLYRSDRSSLLGITSTKLWRSRSCDNPKPRYQPLRSCSASVDGFSEEEFVKNLQELTLRLNLSDDEDVADSRYKEGENSGNEDFSKNNSSINSVVQIPSPFTPSKLDFMGPSWLGIRPEPPEWPEREKIIPASVERKANSVDLPLSLRIIQRKKQWQEGFREAGESAYCSVKKAFSSMVFIIQELHSYTLQMRQILMYEDLQGILDRVQKEMNASFVWLFQQVFSHTPTLMVYVMILLANFTVHSMAHNTAIAAPSQPSSYAATMETVSVIKKLNHQQPKFDSSAIKSFSVSSTTSDGRNNGGGGKVRPLASGTDGGDGWFDGSSSLNHHRTILPDEISEISSFGNPTTRKEAGPGSEFETEAQEMARQEELKLWNSIVEEASRMQTAVRGEALVHDTMRWFVSPVTVEIEQEDYSDYVRTDLQYQLAVSQDPKNSLLLSNYAQFLYLVVHDNDRAEEYFKRAIRVEPPDAEALSRYANFMWLAKKDLGAAEETYLEAIAADPENTFHAGTYAHFLWNSGGEDTCYPLNLPSTNDNEA